jgi:hypothetical protein
MTGSTHSFEARLDRHGVGKTRKVWYTVLFLPQDIATGLPFDQHPQLRIVGEIADVPVKNAFISAGDGRYYVIVSPEVLKAAEVKRGDLVEMRFRVADQAAVDVPDVLTHALKRNRAAKTAWDALTVARRRGLAHHIVSAKTESTQARRVAAVIAAITDAEVDGSLATDVQRLDRLLGRRRAP